MIHCSCRQPSIIVIFPCKGDSFLQAEVQRLQQEVRWTLRWLEHGEAQTREADGFQFHVFFKGGNPTWDSATSFQQFFESISYGENWEWMMGGCEFFPMILETTFHWFLTRQGGENSGSLIHRYPISTEDVFSWEVGRLRMQLHSARAQSDVRQQKLVALETGHQSRDADMVVRSGWFGFSEYCLMVCTRMYQLRKIWFKVYTISRNTSFKWDNKHPPKTKSIKKSFLSWHLQSSKRFVFFWKDFSTSENRWWSRLETCNYLQGQLQDWIFFTRVLGVPKKGCFLEKAKWELPLFSRRLRLVKYDTFDIIWPESVSTYMFFSCCGESLGVGTRLYKRPFQISQQIHFCN